MAVAGVPNRQEPVEQAEAMLQFAIDMIEVLKEYNNTTGRQLQIRIGINTGPVLAVSECQLMDNTDLLKGDNWIYSKFF